MPKIDLPDWTPHSGGPNPPAGQDDGPHDLIILGDNTGLTQFGVHLERLPPGSRASHRHWHETEGEFICLLSGELVLIEDDETILRAGDAAGWKAGQPIAHYLDNRGSAAAALLVVGTRAPRGAVHYPDVILHHDTHGRRYTRADGSPLKIRDASG